VRPTQAVSRKIICDDRRFLNLHLDLDLHSKLGASHVALSPHPFLHPINGYLRVAAICAWKEGHEKYRFNIHRWTTFDARLLSLRCSRNFQCSQRIAGPTFSGHMNKKLYVDNFWTYDLSCVYLNYAHMTNDDNI
jgi:hypothetical protein